jgi:hypothetical protein
MAAIAAKFAILSNDSFGLRFQADHLSLSDPSSFYNAFYPIGYPLFLRICGIVAASPFPVALMLQIVVAACFAYVVYRIAVLILPRTGALLAAVMTLLFPDIVRAELSTVPDLFALAAVTLAVYSLFEARPLVAGVWMGIATMFRFHTIAFAAAVVIALLFMPNERRAVWRLMLGCIPFVALCAALQLWSGGPISMGSGFNIWKTMHGVDWTNVPQRFEMSALDVILREPSRFFSSWLGAAKESWYIWLPLLLFIVLTVRRPVAAIVRAVVIAAFLYHGLTMIGGSARGPLLILPIAIMAAVWSLLTIARIPTESRIVRRMVYAAIGGASAMAIAIVLIQSSEASSRVESYEALSKQLGLTSRQDAQHIYTDDYALYFPQFADATPRTSGGWPELGLPIYSRTYPHIPDSTSDALYASLKSEGIRYVVIRGRPLNSNAFDAARLDTVRFQSIPAYGYHIYRLR